MIPYHGVIAEPEETEQWQWSSKGKQTTEAVNSLVREDMWVFVSHHTVQSYFLYLLVFVAQELKKRNGGVRYLLGLAIMK